MDKKEINFKTATRAIITGFISYGILISFICFVILYALNENFKILSSQDMRLTLCVPIICSILFVFILHFLCRLSTFDVCKKCKTNKDNTELICRKLNIFFFILLFVLFIFIIIKLFTTIYNMEIALYTTSSIQSQVFSNDFNNILTKEMFNDYSMTKLHLIIRTFIYETGLIIGFLLLIPFQKRMILKYNK